MVILPILDRNVLKIVKKGIFFRYYSFSERKKGN